MTASSGTTPALRTPLRLGVIVPVLLTIILLPASLIALVQPVALPLPLILVAGVLFIGLHAVSFLASRHPLPAFAAASAIMLALALFPVVAGVGAALYPSGLAYLLFVHQVAVRCARRWALAAIAIAVVGSAIVAITTTEIPDALLRFGVFLGLAAANAAAWAFGLLQRVRQAQAVEREQSRLREARAAERARISAELHDVVAHALTVMIAQADVARGFLREQPEVSDRALGVVLDSGRDALRGLRGIVRDDAADAGGPRVPTPDLDDITALIAAARSPETRIDHDQHGVPLPLPVAARLALLSVIREGLTNAIRHTVPPRSVRVRVEWETAAVTATIDDDGGSARPDAPHDPDVPRGADLGTGTGLIGLAERARLVGGTLESGATAGGWRLTATLPVSDAGSAAIADHQVPPEQESP
ncbi:histidine kinase [Microbacterium sp. Mu-80]|uniref:histidine kinase n=1 Tax=Microbacterium bandirmense TaxID=3122050 RepID=A0ABU8LBK3_9MICO